ncbi:MAG TPA: AmmeMemoRadiSam system protein A [Kofleriaceae bacterium]|nr:AmmeMemoRadiSam system protein A [Kofleriaceae bacterium]
MAYDFVLGPDEKREVLRIARATVSEFLCAGRIPPGRPHRRSLLASAGAFVTLRVGEELRGCIGTQSEDAPLYRAVQEMAVAAATRDPRFPPLRPDEIESIVIEVSVLGERTILRHPRELEIGVHGLSISCRGQRGLLLPQVAAESGWTAEEFLQHVCVKAQLSADAWRAPDATVERFTAQVFAETEYPPLDPQEILAQVIRDSESQS